MRNIDKLKIKLANVTIQLASTTFSMSISKDMLNVITELRHKQDSLIMQINELEKDDITYFAEAI